MNKFILLLLLALPTFAQVHPPPVKQPPVKMNDSIGSGGNFPLLHSGTIQMSDANYTMTYPDMSASVLRIVSSVPLTATRNVIAPAEQGFEFTVTNITTGNHDIVFKTAAGTGVTIPYGETMLVVSNGTDYVAASGGAVGGSTEHQVVFRGVSDAVKDEHCSITNGSHNLTCSDGPFATCPKGKTVSVTGGILRTFISGWDHLQHSEPNSLITEIESCTNANTAVMVLPASNTRAQTVARWGTDNGPAMFAQANARSTYNKTFVVPAGQYLVRTHPGFPGGGAQSTAPFTGQSIDVYPNTSYDITPSAHIYWVGPTGCSAYDWDCGCAEQNAPPECTYNDQTQRLFLMHDPDIWNFGDKWVDEWGGTFNVHMQIDGIIEGDNTDDNGIGVPFLNQSAVVFWVGTNIGLPMHIHDNTFEGSGTFLNLYGFSIHGAGTAVRLKVRGLVHKHVAKGLNVNGGWHDQSYNSFYDSFGIETGGTASTFIGNIFNHSAGLTLGGARGGYCPGAVVAQNTFWDMTLTNLDMGMCPKGAVVIGNSFFIPDRFRVGSSVAAINMHDDSSLGDMTPSDNNLITSNVFYTEPDCFAALFSYGEAVSANVYSNNLMTGPCAFGYVFNSFSREHPDMSEIIKNDIIKSNLCDILVGANVRMTLDGPTLSNGCVDTFTSGGTLLNNSWYHAPDGMHHKGKIKAEEFEGMGAGGGGGGPGAELNLPQTPGVLVVQKVGGGTGAQRVDVGHPAIGSSGTPSGTSMVLTGFVAPHNSRVVDCSLWYAYAAPEKAYCSLYDSDGGDNSPGTLLCADTVGTVPQTDAWSKHNLSGCPELVADHKYYIGMMGSTAGVITYELGSFGLNSYGSDTIVCCTAPPSIAGQVGAGNMNLNFSMYMTLEYEEHKLELGSTLGSGYLHFDGTNYSWSIPQGTGDGGPGFAAAGDLSGTATNQQVVGIRTHTVPNVSTPGYLHWDGGAFEWKVPATSGGAITTIGGDLGGSATSQQVLGIRSHSIPAVASGYLHYTPGGAFSWDTPSGGFTAGGDLGGSATSQSVIGIHSTAVPALSTAGYLHWTGTELAWDTPAPSGGGAITTIGGDLGGSATSQQVIGMHSHGVPNVSGEGYLHWTGGAFAWDMPSGTGGTGDSISSLTSATKANQLENSHFQQQWRWQFNGTGGEGGLTLQDHDSTNYSAVLFTIQGSNQTSPMSVTAGNGNGFGVTQQGNVVTQGNAHFVGTFITSNVVGQVECLQADGSGLVVGAGVPCRPTFTNLGAATADRAVSNATFQQTWQWHLDGSGPRAGLVLSEDTPSNNTADASALFNITTVDGSSVSPFRATAHLTPAAGMRVTSTGNIEALGTARFIGPVRLPIALANQVTLSTDANGDLGPARGHSISGGISMRTVPGRITGGFSIPSCTDGICTVVTPVVDTAYMLGGIVTQVAAGNSGACGPAEGVVTVQYGYTNADTGEVVNTTLDLAAAPAAQPATITTTLHMGSTPNGPTTNWSMIPRDIYAKAGSPVTFGFDQTTVSDCNVPPIFAIHLYAEELH